MITAFNEFISISGIIIIYELVLLFLFYTKIISKKKATQFLSPILLLNFFIIFVMFLTDCEIDIMTKVWVVSIKILLLIAVLFITEFTFINIFISLLIIAVYYLFSNINQVYSCNVKIIDLCKSLLFSLLIYCGLLFRNTIKNHN
jgi:hypothetical protein